jgi:hypothetical protein
MGFWEGDVNMDLNTLPSVESNDPIEDLDLSFREDNTFDVMDTLLPMTVWRVFLTIYNQMYTAPTNCPFVRC